MKRILDSLCAKQNLCALYINSSNMDSFVFGRIAAVDEEHFLLETYDPNGMFDGFLMFANDIIIKIEYDSLYCMNLEKLCNFYRERIAFHELIKRSVLDDCCKQRRIVSFELLDSGNQKFDVVGIILDTDEQITSVLQIGEYGDKDGIVVLNTDDITGMQFDSSEERRYERLYAMKNNLNDE